MSANKKLILLIIWFFSMVQRVDLSAQSINYGNNKAAGSTIVLNGVKHYYEVYGNGAPILLIHGNKSATNGWAPQIEYFSKKYKVYSVDCRGRGNSELGNDSLTYFQMALDISEFIKQMKIDSVNVIGKSDGGIVGILLGIYFPDQIKKIVAFGANMQPDTTALYATSVNEIHLERLRSESMLASGDTGKNWLIEKLRYRLMEFQPHITSADLRKIKIPVLVMSCDRDVIKEEHTLFIYRNIPNANLSILTGEKHGVARLNPDVFNSTIDRYLSQPFRTDDYRFSE
jgi:pimeloyl-ACP methyl ester carboxylesterase